MIRKRGTGLQVQVYAGRDPLTGSRRYVSQQVPGHTRPPCARPSRSRPGLPEEIGAGRHKGSRSRTVTELLERWLEWRPTVRPIAPTTVSGYRAAMDRYVLPALGKLPSARSTPPPWTPSTPTYGPVAAGRSAAQGQHRP